MCVWRVHVAVWRVRSCVLWSLFDFAACLQGLRIDFEVFSSSEKQKDFRRFFMDNFPSKAFTHVFETMEGQVDPKVSCLSCAQTNTACEDSCRATLPIIDLMVTGSPCDPFSVQRAKRWCNGSVKSHEDYSVTMSAVLQMYTKYEPHVGIFEQVKGFTMPLVAGGTTTPYDRLGGKGLLLRVGSLPFCSSALFRRPGQVPGSFWAADAEAWRVLHREARA